jgi:hypothetical protein
VKLDITKVASDYGAKYKKYPLEINNYTALPDW